MSITVSRINITLPKNLIIDLKKAIPERKRSRVITEVLKEKIARMKREESLKKLRGAWSKFGGVTLKSDADIRAWRKSLWSTADKRLLRKIRG